MADAGKKEVGRDSKKNSNSLFEGTGFLFEAGETNDELYCSSSH